MTDGAPPNDRGCRACGKIGHLYNQCKLPITSIGFIVFRILNKQLQYLMIRRKDTLGFIDFMRGKYSINNKAGFCSPLKVDFFCNNIFFVAFSSSIFPFI